jgi:5,10-methylenetetrahydromethanopterin reductase
MAAAGMTEIAYQPAGPDIPRELEAFAKAVQT